MVQLRGAVAFANANGVLDVVCDILEIDGPLSRRNDPRDTPQWKFIAWLSELRHELFYPPERSVIISQQT